MLVHLEILFSVFGGNVLGTYLQGSNNSMLDVHPTKQRFNTGQLEKQSLKVQLEEVFLPTQYFSHEHLLHQ